MKHSLFFLLTELWRNAQAKTQNRSIVLASAVLSFGSILAVQQISTRRSWMAFDTLFLLHIACIGAYVDFIFACRVMKNLLLPSLLFTGFLDLVLFATACLDGGGIYSMAVHWAALVHMFIFFLLGSTLGVCALGLVCAQNIIITWFVSGSPSIPSPPAYGLSQIYLLLGCGMVAALFNYERSSAFRKIRKLRVENAKIATLLRDCYASRAAFLSNLSHELRTPIHGLAALTDELSTHLRHTHETTLVDLKTSELLTLLGDCTRHIIALVDVILELGKSPEDAATTAATNWRTAMVPNHVAFDTVSEISKAVDMFQITAAAKEVRLQSVDMSTARLPHPMRVGDPIGFRQILCGILNNAIHFTPKGGLVRVRCGVDTVAEPDRIRVEVQNSDAHTLSDHPQPSESHAAQSDAVGTELTLSKKLCEAMGGHIGVVSERGHTRTVWFDVRLPWETIPRSVSAVAESGEPFADAAVCASENADGVPAEHALLRGKCILVCEDNIVNVRVVTAMLQTAGCHVVVAANGKEGVTMFEQDGETYDAILMDCHMPVMDGFTAALAIREIEHRVVGAAETLGCDRVDSMSATAASQLRHRCPIIALTASGARERCLESGMNDMLKKPFKRDQLLGVLKKWIVVSSATADTHA